MIADFECRNDAWVVADRRSGADQALPGCIASARRPREGTQPDADAFLGFR